MLNWEVGDDEYVLPTIAVAMLANNGFQAPAIGVHVVSNGVAVTVAEQPVFGCRAAGASVDRLNEYLSGWRELTPDRRIEIVRKRWAMNMGALMHFNLVASGFLGDPQGEA